MSDVEGLLEEEKDLRETGRSGFGHPIPCEFSALCFSLSRKILIASLPCWALFVKHVERTQQTL